MLKNTKFRTNEILVSLSFFVILTITATMLCGCNSLLQSSSDKDKANNQAYLTELHAISQNFGNIINDFQTDIKDKNVDSMKEKVDASNKLIDEFNKLEPPEACTEVHKIYGDAFLMLQQALSNYLQIYTDYINNSFDSSVLNQRIADVQNSYNQGVVLLNQADSKALDI